MPLPSESSSFPTYNCTSSATIDDAQLLDVYIGPAPNNTPGLLPATSNLESGRDTNNTLKSSVVDDIVNKLMVNVIPNSNTTDADTYHEKILTFLNNVNKEFCFYYSRYSKALNSLLKEITTGYTNQNTDNTLKINANLATLKTLNTRLNDLTLIAHKVSQNLAAKSNDLQEQINTFKTQMNGQRIKLTEQNKIITSGNADIIIRKEMVKFTEEKARNSDNLLKLYSFLNVVVLGLLVYVYKAASD